MYGKVLEKILYVPAKRWTPEGFSKQEIIFGAMNSIGEECTELKKKYDDCFNSWFADHFLKGRTDDSMCASIFRVYQDCVKKAMKEQNIEFKDVEEDVLGTDKEFKPPPRKPESS